MVTPAPNTVLGTPSVQVNGEYVLTVLPYSMLSPTPHGCQCVTAGVFVSVHAGHARVHIHTWRLEERMVSMYKILHAGTLSWAYRVPEPQALSAFTELLSQ